MDDNLLKSQVFHSYLHFFSFLSTTPAITTKILHPIHHFFRFEGLTTFRSHPEALKQVLIIISSVGIRQNRITSLAPVVSVPIAVRYQYQKSSSLELYLVNPCGAEQESLIVLLANNPFAGRIASPLSHLISETSPLCFRKHIRVASDIITGDERWGCDRVVSEPQLAPRDVLNTIHELGESSHQAELRAQLYHASQDLLGTRYEIQQLRTTLENIRTTVLEILMSHLTLMKQVNALDMISSLNTLCENLFNNCMSS
ncbi:hypothetical protein E3N88_26417 [Mikania micrantha]|uniref:Uncharacterized protein n=1 Tax=Mikania micrantha TaxID=192012 RepID=A0A5N6NA77_9ASTR|nr:hypothetical protein E3N88_26417 [Mikania micrantha]